MDLETVSLFLDQAVRTFLKDERRNILSGVSERSLCGRLALVLEGQIRQYELVGYFADTEYNRKQSGQIKTILDEQMKIVRITCDLIVHSRGEKRPDNLVALEMKKSGQPEHEKENDRVRLRALTKDVETGVWSHDGETHPDHVAGYLLGVYMEVDADEEICLFEYYRNGSKIREEQIAF